MKFTFSTLFCVLFTVQVMAQLTVPNYRFIQTQSTYTALTGGTVLGSETTDDQLFSPDNIGGVATFITGTGFPIGFNFLYEGLSYSSFMVSNNGYIRLGNGTFTIRSSLSNALRDSSEVNGADFNQVICGLNGDLQSQVGSRLTIHNVGTAPNRSCVVQFSNFKHFGSTGEGDNYNFQIRLNEADQSVEIVYGNFVKNSTDRNYTVGIRGTTQRQYNSRLVIQGQDTWLTSRRSTSVLQTCQMTQSLIPVNGLSYKFLPPLLSEIDLAVSNVYFGTPGANDCAFEDNETIKVDVINIGSDSQSTALVSYRLNNEAFRTKTVTFNPPLAQFQTYVVEFDGADAADLASFTSFTLTAAVFIASEGDSTRYNDTLTRNFQLNQRNLPIGPFNSFSTLTNPTNGWKEGTGRFAPSGTTASWATAFPFPVETIGLEVVNTNTSLQEWLFSPKYNYDTSGTYIVKMNVALTSDLFGTTAISSIGDDSIKVMYSTDCQITWKQLRAFTNVDLQNGTVNNTLREVIVSAPRTSGSNISFAFLGYGNGTGNLAGTYRFHINNLRIDQIFGKDLATTSVVVPGIIDPSCAGSGQETVRVVVRNIGADPVSAALVGYRVNSLAAVTRNLTFIPALLTGDSSVVLFSGTDGADMSLNASYRVKGFCFQAGENGLAQLNDTAMADYSIVGPAALPSPTYTTYAMTTGGGWRRGTGATTPSGTISGWAANTDLNFANPSISILISQFTTLYQDWLYSGSFISAGSIGIKLKVGVAATGGGATSAANVNDDSLKVMVSTDCGNTWFTAKSFTRLSVSNNEIGNGNLREVSAILTNHVGNVRVAFLAKSNNTSAPTTYRWHLDDVIISAFANNDLAATRVFVQQLTGSTCPLSAQESVFVEVRNEGSVPQTSSEVGFRLNNGAIVRRNFTFAPGPLQPGSSTIVTFSGADAVNLSQPGTYRLRGYVFLPSEPDEARANDSTSIATVNIGFPYGLPYRQTFDSALVIPTGWSRDGSGFSKFRINSARGFLGSSALSTNLTATNLQSFVTTPPFGPVAANHVMTLIYKIVNVQTSNAVLLRKTDSLTIFASTNCGQSFVVLAKVDSANFARTSAFQSLNIPLGAYAGSNVTFRILARILNQTQAGAYVDIDNFFLQPSTDITAESFTTAFSVYPNPANDQLNINWSGKTGSMDKYLILNAMGKQVQAGNLAHGTNSISIAHLPSGIYLIKAKGAQGNFEKKVAITR